MLILWKILISAVALPFAIVIICLAFVAGGKNKIPPRDEMQNDFSGDINFSQVIVLDDPLELDTLLCALDEFVQHSPKVELVEIASRMRSQIANDAGRDSDSYKYV